MQAYGNSRILFADYNNFVNAGRLCRSFPWRTKESAIAYVVFLYYYFVVVVTNLNIVPRLFGFFSRLYFYEHDWKRRQQPRRPNRDTRNDVQSKRTSVSFKACCILFWRRIKRPSGTSWLIELLIDWILYIRVSSFYPKKLKSPPFSVPNPFCSINFEEIFFTFEGNLHADARMNCRSFILAWWLTDFCTLLYTQADL